MTRYMDTLIYRYSTSLRKTLCSHHLIMSSQAHPLCILAVPPQTAATSVDPYAPHPFGPALSTDEPVPVQLAMCSELRFPHMSRLLSLDPRDTDSTQADPDPHLLHASPQQLPHRHPDPDPVDDTGHTNPAVDEEIQRTFDRSRVSLYPTEWAEVQSDGSMWR